MGWGTVTLLPPRVIMRIREYTFLKIITKVVFNNNKIIMVFLLYLYDISNTIIIIHFLLLLLKFLTRYKLNLF